MQKKKKKIHRLIILMVISLLILLSYYFYDNINRTPDYIFSILRYEKKVEIYFQENSLSYNYYEIVFTDFKSDIVSVKRIKDISAIKELKINNSMDSLEIVYGRNLFNKWGYGLDTLIISLNDSLTLNNNSLEIKE